MCLKRFIVCIIALATLEVQSTNAALQILSETSIAPGGGAVHDPFQPIFTGGSASSVDILQGFLPTSSLGNFTQETSAGPVALTNGLDDTVYPLTGNGGDAIDHAAYATGGNNGGSTLTYTLGGVFNVQEIVVYGGWNDAGRDAQNYNVLTSSNGGVSFNLLGSFSNGTGIDGGDHPPIGYRVEFSDTLAGNIATGITHLRFDFLTVENGFTGYSEIDVFGAQVFLPGDADRDGDVDIDDFYLISDNFLSIPSAAGLDGDVVPNNFVDVADFRLWKDNAPPAVLAQLQGINIPEPASLVLAVGVLLCGGRRYGRSR